MTTKEIWKKYSEELKRFILSKVKDEMEADDILQDTFIKIHTKLNTLKDDKKLKSWLFSVAHYTILDYFKTSKNSLELKEIQSEDAFQINEHSEKDCLRGILRNLPKKYREPIFLSDIMGLKQSEIALKLNRKLSTVKSQIQRARKQIAKGFMDCCGYKLNREGYLVGEIKDKGDCKICN